MTQQPWPRDDRIQMMRNFIRIMDEEKLLARVKPGQVAVTYGLLVPEVEAEIMRHQFEGGDK